MKPRIYFRRGVWCCRVCIDSKRWMWHMGSPLGHGYTPAEAYDDWKAQAQ